MVAALAAGQVAVEDMVVPVVEDMVVLVVEDMVALMVGDTVVPMVVDLEEVHLGVVVATTDILVAETLKTATVDIEGIEATVGVVEIGETVVTVVTEDQISEREEIIRVPQALVVVIGMMIVVIAIEGPVVGTIVSAAPAEDIRTMEPVKPKTSTMLETEMVYYVHYFIF